MLPKGSAVDTTDKLTSVLNVKEDQGNYKVGDTILKDTPLEEIIRKMLTKTNYPSFTDPTATLTATGSKLMETGSTATIDFTITYNAGKIHPQYGAASEFRAGIATAYALNGNEQATNTFQEIVSETNKDFVGYVKYAEGVQPKDDEGNDYDHPYAAGQVPTNPVNFEFVDALYANTADINVIAKLGLVSKGSGSYIFDFPAQSETAPHEWHVPASWTVARVEFLNTLNNQYEQFSQFDTGTITHKDAAGNDVNYVTYKDNRGVAAGKMKIKITFS